MSVDMQQFRVVGVRIGSGQDVSVVIDAASKAAAEVKAEQLGIETTHIARLKKDEPQPPTEAELFSAEAAEALSSCRTDKLIEEVAHHAQEPRQKPEPPPPPKPEPVYEQPQHEVVTALTRPTYAAPAGNTDSSGANVSGVRAFSFVLLVLLGICAGAYFVLVVEPNKVQAEEHELLFGQDLFTDVGTDNSHPKNNVRDAFSQTGEPKNETAVPATDDERFIVIGKPTSADKNAQTQSTRLSLQSVVTSHEGRFAIINGKFYKEGSAVAGCKLMSIADDWVLLEKDGKQFTLKIEAK